MSLCIWNDYSFKGTWLIDTGNGSRRDVLYGTGGPINIFFVMRRLFPIPYSTQVNLLFCRCFKSDSSTVPEEHKAGPSDMAARDIVCNSLVSWLFRQQLSVTEENQQLQYINNRAGIAFPDHTGRVLGIIIVKGHAPRLFYYHADNIIAWEAFSTGSATPLVGYVSVTDASISFAIEKASHLYVYITTNNSFPTWCIHLGII